MPLVLVLDRDLSFLWLLSQGLSEHGIATLPSRTETEAKKLLAEIDRGLDLLVVNCSCSGACTLALEMRESHPALRILGLTSEQHPCENCLSALSLTLPDPDVLRQDRVQQITGMIRSLVTTRRAP